MGKKLTYDSIKKSFEDEGYILLSTTYINNRTKLQYQCPLGHIHSNRFDTWRSGHRCPVCSGSKLHISIITEAFEKEGYTIIDTEYKNNATPINYVCPNGHTHKVSWGSWLEQVRCPYCNPNGRVKNRPIENIKKDFEMEGYVLLSTEFISATSKLDYICPEGHKHSVSWNKWQQGVRCFYCNGSVKYTIEQAAEAFKKEGYTLLSTEYINNNTKLIYRCDKGHEHSISYNSWQQGVRCPYCAGQGKPTIEEVRLSFEKEGYTLLSTEYHNSITKLNYICNLGHSHDIIYDSWKRGSRCPICAVIKNSGPGHYNWQEGLTYQEYCEVWQDQEYKQDIRERDGNRCLNPYCNSKNPNKLVIHHVNYNKQDCHFKNLITVCSSCNAKANFDRAWHKDWYQALLHNRYGYIYDGH